MLIQVPVQNLDGTWAAFKKKIDSPIGDLMFILINGVVFSDADRILLFWYNLEHSYCDFLDLRSHYFAYKLCGTWLQRKPETQRESIENFLHKICSQLTG